MAAAFGGHGHGALRRVAALMGDDFDEHATEERTDATDRGEDRREGAEGGGKGRQPKNNNPSRNHNRRNGDSNNRRAPWPPQQEPSREQQQEQQQQQQQRRQLTVVAAVIENRAKEVGLALFDKEGGPSLSLEQVNPRL
jgi:hypothetical protein